MPANGEEVVMWKRGVTMIKKRFIQQEPGQFLALPKVDRIYLELSNICNFNCEFCPIDNSKRKKQYMEFSLLQKAVDEIAEKEITGWIAFHILGEPLLYPKLLDAVRYVKSKGLKLLITTNGALLTSEIIDRLIELKVDKLSISIETTDEEAHESRRSGVEFTEYYNRILEAVRIIKTSSGDINIVLSMMNTSTKKYFDIDKNIAINVKKSDFKSKLSSFIGDIYASIERNVSGEKIAQSLVKLNCNVSKGIKIDEQIRVYIQMFMDWGNSFTTKRVYPSKIGFCGYALNNVGILSNGNVAICCADYDGNTSLGNLKNNSLVSLLLSKKAMAVKEGFNRFRIIHPYCQRCLGGTNRVKAFFKGLLSIYLFKVRSHPLKSKEVEILV